MSQRINMQGTCKICGCTQEDCTQCIERYGSPCSWTDNSETLCSACQVYIDELDHIARVSEETTQLFRQMMKDAQVSKLEHDQRTNIWKIYYTWDLSGVHATAFASAEDLLLFLTADHSGN